MSKRVASETQAYTKRKRKKNGISKSSSVLELTTYTPRNSSQFMRVLHTNVEDPSSVRRSAVPRQPKPENKQVPTETYEEDFATSAPVPEQPKRRQENDSVSGHMTWAT